MRLAGFACTITLLLAVPAVCAAQAGDGPPTFAKEVAPILFNHCVACHRPGEAAPFPLLTYQDAKKRAKLIARVTKDRQMPPWKADQGDVAFRNQRQLSDRQIGVFQAWAAAGMPEGDPQLVPPLPAFAEGWPLGKPDLVVKMARAYRVPAEGRDIYRNFVIPLGLTEDKWVKAIDFRPSARSVVHHTLFYVDGTGNARKLDGEDGAVGFSGGMARLGGGRLLGGLGGLGGEGGAQKSAFSGLGGWALGAQPRMLPDGLAYPLAKGSDLILATHFHPSGKVELETSTVALYFADKAPKKRFTGLQLPPAFGAFAKLDIPAGKKDYAIQDAFVLPVDVKAFGVSAHAHYLGKNFKLTATLPNGKNKTLLGISDWDFAWQEQYQFQDYVLLPKGTKLQVKMTYDNSADNPRNPTVPPKRVRWGRESTDEMGSITLQVVAANETDMPRLQQAYRLHVREALLKNPGLMKKLGIGQ